MALQNRCAGCGMNIKVGETRHASNCPIRPLTIKVIDLERKEKEPNDSKPSAMSADRAGSL